MYGKEGNLERHSWCAPGCSRPAMEQYQKHLRKQRQFLNTSRRNSFSVSMQHGVFDELHVSVSGTVCVDNADRVRTELTQVIESQPLKNVVLDLAAIEYLDSSGAAVLVEVFRLCDRLNNSLRLMNVPPRVT